MSSKKSNKFIFRYARNLVRGLVGVVFGLFSPCLQGNEIDLVYEDPLDWRLQPEYRVHWIKSNRCFLERNYECAVEKLKPLWSIELSTEQKIELGRATATSYTRLAEQAKRNMNWENVLKYSKLSFQFDDRVHNRNWNREGVVSALLRLGSWQECVDAAVAYEDLNSEDVEVSDVSSMHVSRCLYELGRIEEAANWIRYAQRALVNGDRFDDLSFWGSEIRRVESAIQELGLTGPPLLTPFWWDRSESRGYILAAIQCDRTLDHHCAIENLEKLDVTDLTSDQRGQLQRTLSRHYSFRSSYHPLREVTAESINDEKKAVELHDDPRRKVYGWGGLVHSLALTKDWAACISEGLRLFTFSGFVQTQDSHSHAMSLAYCFYSSGDIENSRIWIEKARRFAQSQGTFVHESWAWLLKAVESD